MHSPRVIFPAALVSFFGLASALQVRAVAYYDPTAHGGSMLDNAGNGLGEPLNVIVSGLSSPVVLSDEGIMNYARAIGFSTECLGVRLEGPHSANLGDGNGLVNQTMDFRQDYGNAATGACTQSLDGGNNFRVYRQDGASGDSGALFLAVSKEGPATNNHTIVPDGYNIARDELVSGAVGQLSFGGVSYSTTAQNITGLLPPGSVGVNHGISQDGVVTLLTVTTV